MAGAHLNIATSYNIAGRPAETVEHYQKGFELQPEKITHVFLNYEYGNTYMQLGELDKAEAVFRLMLDEPEEWKQTKGYRSLGLLEMYRGRYGVAIEHLQEAAKINRTAREPLSEVRDRLFLAAAYLLKGRQEAAEEELERVEAIRQEEYIAPFYLQIYGSLLLRIGQVEQAAQLLALVADEMQEGNKEDQAVLALFEGELALARGDTAAALPALERAAHFQRSIFIRFGATLAHAYLLSGRLEEARDAYAAIVAGRVPGRENQEPWILARYYLAQVYDRLGQFDEAVSYYEQFLDIWQSADADLQPVVDARERLATLQSLLRQEQL